MVLLAAELLEIRTRRSLPHRVRPYFEVIDYGGPSVTSARTVRPTGLPVRQEAAIIDDGDRVLRMTVMPQMVRSIWIMRRPENELKPGFSFPEQSSVSTDRFARGPTYRCWFAHGGDEYTVTHAMHDLVEWKRISAARTHLQTMISHINFHIIPRLGTIRLSEFKGTHVQAFIRDVLECPACPGNSTAHGGLSFSELTAEELPQAQENDQCRDRVAFARRC